MSKADYMADYRKRRIIDGYQSVFMLGAQRRLQALACLGWSMPALSERCELSRWTLRDIARGTRTIRVTLRVQAVICALYDELCMTPAPARTKAEKVSTFRAKHQAARLGWAPPLAWDDIDSDLEPMEVFSHEPVLRYCKQGHPITVSNSYAKEHPNGSTYYQCGACAREASKEQWRRKAAA